MEKIVLRLYVTGKTTRSLNVVEDMKRICSGELASQVELEVIDVLEHPQLAEKEKIIATPTVIKKLPPPLRRIIGDMADREKVLLGLDLQDLNEE